MLVVVVIVIIVRLFCTRFGSQILLIIRLRYAQLLAWSNYKFSMSTFLLVIRRNCYFSLLCCAAGFLCGKCE